MKRVLLLMLCVFLLSGCFSPTPYEPWGEVYLKSSPSGGDEGITEVVDIEIQNKKYDLSLGRNIPITVGTGYKCGHSQDKYSVLYIAIVSNNEEFNTYVYEYNDFDSVIYESTKAHDSSFLVIPFYDHFYPNYHEQLDIQIPEGITNGHILVQQRHEVDSPYGISIELRFEIIDNILYFHVD